MFSPGLILALGLALVHGFLSELTPPAFIPEKRWFSFAGGVSLSYVFLEVLPELGHIQVELEHEGFPVLIYLENHVYILALAGLLVFYGLDILAVQSRAHNRSNQDQDRASIHIFWIHIFFFVLLNMVLGYLLQDVSNHSLWTCILFFCAIALHFYIIDFSLREHHQDLYDRQGRWFLTGAILLGAILGQAIHLEAPIVSIIWSFLAGTIILNVLKHELPESRQTCYSSFTLGAGVYMALILLT
jgi:hypothetical protein